MTPRNIAAYVFLMERRREREMAHALGIAHLAQNGDGKAVEEQMKKWQDQ